MIVVGDTNSHYGFQTRSYDPTSQNTNITKKESSKKEVWNSDFHVKYVLELFLNFHTVQKLLTKDQNDWLVHIVEFLHLTPEIVFVPKNSL